MIGVRLSTVALLFACVCACSPNEGDSRSTQVTPAASAEPAPVAPPPTPPPATTTPPAAGATVDVPPPCAGISAADVSAIVGFPVTATDEHWRCKYVDAKGGWLTVKRLEASGRTAKEICEYAPSKRTVVPGVGDTASYFGSTACVKVGDVMIVVDGADVAERSSALSHSGAENPFILIGKTIAGRIP